MTQITTDRPAVDNPGPLRGMRFPLAANMFCWAGGSPGACGSANMYPMPSPISNAPSAPMNALRENRSSVSTMFRR